MKPKPTRLQWWTAGERWLLIGYLLLFLPLFRPDVGVSDPTGYYAWARSLLIDGDLDLTNEFQHFGMGHAILRTPTGYVHNQWAAGSAWLWLPLMGVAHGLVGLGGILGWPLPADGYSWPYVWAAALTTTLTGLAALLIVYRLARALFGNTAALVATLAVWLATPLVFYQYHQPLMAHANDAFLNALFVLTWWQARRANFAPAYMVYLALVIGAAVWVRTQNGILLIALCADLVYEPLSAWLRDRRMAGWKSTAGRAFYLLLGFALLFAPLSIFWRIIYGGWLVNTYDASGGGTLTWSAPHWLDVLFSSDRGLFVWAPVTLIALAGLRPLFATDARLARLLTIVALLHWYVISCWSIWAGGHAFGPRLWIALTPFWGLALAALLDGSGRWRPWVGRLIVGVVGLLIVWNILLMLQYSIGLVAPTGEVDLALMVKNQFAMFPQLLTSVLERIDRMMAPL
jgi:hypothetical protein